MRRSLLVVMLLAACELKPPPPKAQPAAGAGSAAPTKATAPATVPAPARPTPTPAPPPTPPAAAAGSAAGSANGRPVPPPPPVVSEACGTVAVHVADVIVQSSDPTQRSFLEQDRARLVRQAGLSCQRANWNADKIKCFAATKTQAEFDVCNKMP